MKRIALYDNLRGFLILLVVLGHVLNICSSHYGYNYSYYKIFTFFMMPLFLFMMGKFSKKSHVSYKKRAYKMLKTYIILEVVTTLIYKYVFKIISIDSSYLVPRFTLWYLLTSFYYYLSDGILKKLNYKVVLIVSIICSLGCGFIPFIDNTLSISRTIGFFPFYALGYYEDVINIENKVVEYKNIFIVLGILISIIFIFNNNFFLSKDTYLKYNYYYYSNPFTCFYKRGILFIIFFIYSGFIYSIFPRRKILFSFFGNKSLDIYLSHGLLLKFISKYKLFLDGSIIGTVMIYVLVVVVGIIIYSLKKKIGEISSGRHNKESRVEV